MRKLLTLLIVACAVVQTCWADILYSQDFETSEGRSSLKSYTQKGKAGSWTGNNKEEYYSSGRLAVYNGSEIDAFAVTPGIKLKGESQYTLRYKSYLEGNTSAKNIDTYVVADNSQDAILSLTPSSDGHIGQSETTTVGKDNENFDEFTFTFSVPRTGTYYLVFEATGKGIDWLFLDDIVVEGELPPGVPTAMSDFAAAGADYGEMKVNLTWTNPTLDSYNQQISQLEKVSIECGDRIIELSESNYLQPGAVLTYQDVLPDGSEAGKYTYKIYGYLNGEPGEALSTTSNWVGLDTPNDLTSFNAELEPGTESTVNLSWVQGTTGKNGGYLDLDRLYYRIERNDVPIVSKYQGSSYVDSDEKEFGRYNYKIITTDENDVAFNGIFSNKAITCGGAISLPYSNDFSSSDAWETITKIGATSWSRNNESARVALAAGLDSWMILPPLKMEKDVTYELDFTSWGGYSTNYFGNLSVWCGNGVTAADMTQQIVEGYDVKAASGTESKKVYFTVPESGTYNIGFHAVLGEGSSSYSYYYLNVDDVAVSKLDITPAAPENLTAIPDADGALKVELSWNNPTLDIVGNELESNLSKVEVYRNEDEQPIAVIEDADKLEPGAKVSYTDNLPEGSSEGYVTYTVKPYLDGLTKDHATVKTWVGLETPNPLANVTLSGKNGEYKVTWDAPTGVHGASLDPARVIYRITRYVNEDSELLTSDFSGVEYIDDFSTEELINLSYEVVAIFGGNEAEAARSNSIKAGYINLPFDDSFAGAQLNPLKWETEVLAGTYNWTPSARVGMSSSNFSSDPVDNDGGAIYYNFYSASSGHGARLMTQPLSKESSSSPVVDFYLYRWVQGAQDDYIQIQISVDGGEWQDIEGGDFHRIPREGDADYGCTTGWYHYNLGFGNYLPETCSTYRIAFTSVSKNGYNMALDAIRIFNVAGSDLAATISAPETVIAGNELELTVTIANNGSDVKSDDYEIVIDTDFPGEFNIDTEDISSLSYKTFTVSVPVTAEEAYNLPSYDFTAKVIFEGDEVEDNNQSETVSVQTAFSQLDSPKNLVAEKDDDDNVTIKWDSVKDLDYEPVNIVETFEEFEVGQAGPYNGFVVLDLDGKAGTPSFSLADWTNGGTLFNVVAPKKTSTQFTRAEGNRALGVVITGTAKESDWVISPAINCGKGENATLNVDLLAAFGKYSSSSTYDYKFEVLYSLEDYSPENPSASFQFVKSFSKRIGSSDNTDFDEYSVTGIPGNAKYIAIHFNSEPGSYQQFSCFIDNIRITENDEAPLLGYHVYERNVGRVNGEALADDVLEHTVYNKARTAEDEENLRYFYATAIYKDGESAPSNLSGISTEVKNILASGAVIAPVSNGILVNGHDGDIAEVYTLDGRKVASMRCTEHTIISVASGVYVVRAGNDTAKVMVK